MLKSGSAVATQGGSTKRKEQLRKIEIYIQSLWEENQVYLSNPPQSWLNGEETERDEQEKFFCTFPYPYMNGRLHLGHAFSLTKAEFQARFQRLKGKRVLWPFAFHCTGMPICACADKLKNELEQGPSVTSVDHFETKNVDYKFSTTKSKAVSKTDKTKTQKEILIDNGVPEDLIPNFVHPEFWVDYFPSIGKKDLKKFGLAVDWRRNFVTTQINPYYDAFIRWQFITLRQRNRIAYGNRPTIFSRHDRQACADHDRLTGEGVVPQCYTLIKMKVQTAPLAFESIPDLATRRVYFIAATLRPETMYGQTNCFALPSGDYGFYLALDKRVEKMNDFETLCVSMTREEALQSCHQVFICSERSAQNMAYQGILPVLADPTAKVLEPICLGFMKGSSLFGIPLSSPCCVYETIYVLPMMALSMEKGTGIVTSVPSDSADDYAALQDLKNKPALREKYNITDKMIHFDPVSVIHIPGYQKHAAIQLYEMFNVKSQHDRVALDKIKEELYKKGFYDGIMVQGPYKGEKVHKVKDLERARMIEANDALLYYEPERLVRSRKGEICVVALCNQWYLDYSNQDWKDVVMSFVCDPKCFNTFNPQCLNQFKHVIQWLREWACSRQYGLGTYIPWELERGKKVVIESLSDSTIYMAYYTIAHYLQGNLRGSEMGSLAIAPEELTNQVFDYIFAQTDTLPQDTSIPPEKLNVLRREFLYWYPLNLRVSGKDLIFNHLTKSLFDHAAIWPKHPEKYWPKSFFCNGHVLVDNQKMSKSLGNFLTLSDTIETFTADATRIALADAGDSLDDANFQRDQANSALMKLYLLQQFAQDLVEEQQKGTLRTGDKSWLDNAFENRFVGLFQQTIADYEQMLFRSALKNGFYDMGILKDQYKNFTGDTGVHQESIFLWLELQTVLLSPIAPHLCDYIWINYLKKPGFLSTFPYLQNNCWMKKKVDGLLQLQYTLLLNVLDDFRTVAEKADVVSLKTQHEVSDKKIGAVVYVAKEYLPWQQAVLKILQRVPLAPCQSKPLDDTFITLVRNDPQVQNLEKKMKNQVMSFASHRMKVDLPSQGPQALHLQVPFDEKALLEENSLILRKVLGVQCLQVRWTTESKHPLDATERIALAFPGKPSIAFFSS